MFLCRWKHILSNKRPMNLKNLSGLNRIFVTCQNTIPGQWYHGYIQLQLSWLFTSLTTSFYFTRVYGVKRQRGVQHLYIYIDRKMIYKHAFQTHRLARPGTAWRPAGDVRDAPQPIGGPLTKSPYVAHHYSINSIYTRTLASQTLSNLLCLRFRL